MKLDHLVLTVKSLNNTIDFYKRVLNLTEENFENGRKSIKVGSQKINLHELGAEFEPKALNSGTGTADLCFITDKPLSQTVDHLKLCGVDIILGPVSRTGATEPILSIYFRDTDGNLIEIGHPI
ncbi:MAG: VOC family protein [bacterium]